MKKMIIEQLESMGYPAFQQGAMNDNEEYPESFFTVWENTSYNTMDYDNMPAYCIRDFDINFYSSDPVKVDVMMPKVKEYMEQHGFIVDGSGYDIASDEKTHTGRGLNAVYREKSKRKD